MLSIFGAEHIMFIPPPRIIPSFYPHVLETGPLEERFLEAALGLEPNILAIPPSPKLAPLDFIFLLLTLAIPKVLCWNPPLLWF
jgi:hypothetical protein